MKKILVVDDEEILTRTYVKLLSKKGYDTFFVKSGDDAVEIVQEVDFDLIITDVRMPGKNGFQTIQEIRKYYADHSKISPPEIILTGYASNELETQIATLHPTAYIYKPFDVSELMSHVERILK